MQKRLFRFILGGLSLALTGLSPYSHAQQFYKWVDQKGSTHYTTTPPPKNAKRQGKIETYNHPNTSRPAAVTTPNSEANPPPQSNNFMDQQQREANAALLQGRQRE